MKHALMLMVGGLLLAGCQPESTSTPSDAVITESALAGHIETLSSDAFEGRAPASAGETQTLNYLQSQFEAVGIGPGNGTSYLQEVPLVSITADPAITYTVNGGTGTTTYAYGTEMMAGSLRLTDEITLNNSELVFVGYGIVAPEYGWNDYAGLDVTGKTVVILVNDPGFATQDSTLFNGNAMTYYGRWTYKYEEASRQGAEAALIVHETAPAGYPWAVVANSWSGPQFNLVTADGNASRVAVEGWFTHDAAQQVFAQAGQDYEALKVQAARPGFQAVPLGVTGSLRVKNTFEESKSNNFIALLPGTTRPDEYILYVAHWDHLGKDPTLEGDQIYNGAVDNATGTAALITLARAFKEATPAPERSIVFLAVTAEEQGLLGSAYYSRNPIFPTAQTVAVLNMDALGNWGETKDITVIGYGNSELETYAQAAAEAQGRYLRPDPEPQKGFYYRSDHFSFAKVGIPALYMDSGIDHVTHGEAWTQERIADYTANRYHKPADEYDAETWDLSGTVKDVQFFYAIGRALAMDTTFPNWYDGNEFKALRDADRE